MTTRCVVAVLRLKMKTKMKRIRDRITLKQPWMPDSEASFRMAR